MLDALHQMNGEFVDMLVHPRRDETLDAIAKIPGTSQAERIASLYLATVSRRPSPEEITQIESALTQKSETEAAAFTFSDLLWAILNSAEFNSNH